MKTPRCAPSAPKVHLMRDAALRSLGLGLGLELGFGLGKLMLTVGKTVRVRRRGPTTALLSC